MPIHTVYVGDFQAASYAQSLDFMKAMRQSARMR